MKKDDILEAIKTIKPVAEKCGVTDEELNDLLVLENSLFNKYPLNLSDKAKEDVVGFSREFTQTCFMLYEEVLEKVISILYGYWSRTGVDIEKAITEKGVAKVYYDELYSQICQKLGW